MLLVIGGQASKVGKTALATCIIRKFRELDWTAIKVSTHAHGSGIESGETSWTEEAHAGPSDSGRFLGAGAKRAFLVRANGAFGSDAVAQIAGGSGYTIVESTGAAGVLAPDLFLMALDTGRADFKPSSLRAMERADAFVVVQRAPGNRWDSRIRARAAGTKRFLVTPPDYAPAALIAFLRSRLSPVSN